MSKLKENFNSQYLGAYLKLKPKKAPKQIQVYVESEDDISFWRHIFKNFETNDIQFIIQLPSNTSLAKGKKIAIERNNIFSLIPITNLGDFLIICIDSDYDYLLKNYSLFSNDINTCDYIFQTYLYSIENYKCYSRNLHNLCVSATLNDNLIVDFEELLKMYSQITYELLLWNLYFYNIGDYNTFTLSDFCDIARILEEPKASDLGESFDNLKNRVTTKINELEANYSDIIIQVKELGKQLTDLGLTQENAYLFIQGHTIFDNVVLMFLKSICKSLRNEHELKIKSLAKHNQELKTNIDSYHNHLKRNNIEFLLANNYDFKDCFLFSKLNEDVVKYLDKLKRA